MTSAVTSDVTSPVTSRLARGVALLALCAGVGLSASEASGDDGLPPPEEGQLGGSVATTGRGEIAVGRQWFRMPRLALWAQVGTDDGADPPNVRAEVYVMSPASGRHRYGESPAFGVRTLAFGLIPAGATVQIAQLRDGRFPEPWVVSGGPVLSEGDHVMEGRAEIRITALELDGEAVGDITGVCRAGPLTLRLGAGPGYLPYGGGELSGTIDVPAFRGCGNPHLDRLVTSMVSGPGNRIAVRQGPISIGKPWPDTTPEQLPLEGE